MTASRSLGVLCALLLLAAALPAPAAVAREKSLAQFDVGFAQCEKRHPEMRGHGDAVYASLYRLKYDDALRAQLSDARKSAPYKSDRKRAQQTIARSVAASDVAQRLELQCQALKREIRAPAGPGAASAAKG